MPSPSQRSSAAPSASDRRSASSSRVSLSLAQSATAAARIGDRNCQLAFQRAAFPGVESRGLDIDHRFALFAGAFALGQLGQPALRIAAHGQDRVDEEVDRQTVLGNRSDDRIDKERHILVDYRDAHVPPFAARRADQQRRLALLALARGFEQEGGHFVEPLVGEGRLAREDRIGEALTHGLGKFPVVALERRQGQVRSAPRRPGLSGVALHCRHARVLPCSIAARLRLSGGCGRYSARRYYC